MINRLAEVRKSRGIAAARLAGQVGITRQAIYAVEAGTYMPNTATALKLARVLETTVEDLFSLDEESVPAKLCNFEPLDASAPPAPGEPVQICRVGKRTIGVGAAQYPAFLPIADGVVRQTGHAAIASSADDANRLLIAGCDPALSLLAAHAREAGVDVVLANATSARALGWLREGRIDIAGTHVDDPTLESEKNRHGFSVVTFALWEEGFVVPHGNPKSIRTVVDLANPLVRFVNRDIGSGSRKLFDALIGHAGMTLAQVKGSRECAAGHLAAAWSVASGSADCCIATGSAARRFGLDFVPLAPETFRLVLHASDMTRKSVERVLNVLNRSRFRRQLETIAGYDVRNAGDVLSETAAKRACMSD